MIFITNCPSGQDVETTHSQLFLGNLVFPPTLLLTFACDHPSAVRELPTPTSSFTPAAAAHCPWQALPITAHSPSCTALLWTPPNSSDPPFDSHVVTKRVFHTNQLQASNVASSQAPTRATAALPTEVRELCLQ